MEKLRLMAFVLSVGITSSLCVQAEDSVVNDSPYAMFGDSTSTLGNTKLGIERAVLVPVVLKDLKRGVLRMDYGENKVEVLDSIGNIISTDSFGLNDICRFVTIDPMAEKYPSISPYAYCAGNPVRYVDKDGKDVTVLNLDGRMHMAMLIQNKEGKWQYYSINGDNMNVSGLFIGGREFDDIGVGEWDNPQQFLDSHYNTQGDRRNAEINSFGYQEGYVIETTPEQDDVIRNTFINISRDEEYQFLGNNCATTVVRSLNAAGIKTHSKETKTIHVPANHKLGESGFTVKIPKPKPLLPSSVFRTIMELNPKGVYLRKTY